MPEGSELVIDYRLADGDNDEVVDENSCMLDAV